MATLVITRGLPASGKSTWARQWVQDGPRRARVNRDDLRQNLFGLAHGLGFAAEQAVSAAQRSSVETLLRSGWDVVVDDTHLRTKYARAWADLAATAGARFEVRDFTDVPLDVCLQRDAERIAAGGRGVGADVIRDLHQRFLAAGPLPAVTPSDPSRGGAAGAAAADGGALDAAGYVPDGALPSAWLVDVDGTLALMTGRSPYEWTRVGEDEPNHPVVDLVRGLAGGGHAIVVVSGRDGSCRAQTRDWLVRHGIPFDDLLMRAAGDQRKDSVVKREIFDREIRPRWQVRGVLDDRQQVVAMWRAIGLTCAQVAPGDF
jgi:predicted kinase